MFLFNTIICRYNEIATKGNNRSMFETRLADNLRYFCNPVCKVSAQRVRGRIFLYKVDKTAFTDVEKEGITERLKRCFGLESFSFCVECKPDLELLCDLVKESAPAFFEPVLAQKEIVFFRTRARRSDKKFPVHSKDIEIRMAHVFWDMYGDRVKINLTEPDLSLGVEVREETAIIYYDTVKGPGGLPTGCNSPVLALLSGGIDSPVACNMMMKRGCHVEYLTFHSFPYTPQESVDKVARLAKIINQWQKGGRLFACNISEMQKLIRDNCDPKYRTVLYRRVMMRIAEKLCVKNGYNAIVTGEAAGQVASQTIENMNVINRSIDTLILRPLVGMDKNETIRRAEDMDTFNVSIEPMIDSCTVFAPDSPILKGKVHTAEYEESKIPDYEKVLNDTFEAIENIPLI